MEEYVGGLWDRFITRHARRDYPEAAVGLDEVERAAAVFFRALGGDAGLRLGPAIESRHGARRRWLSRVAGSDEKAARAGRDDEALRLPPSLAWFPERGLNRDLYFWLAALAAHDGGEAEWIVRNQRATLAAIEAWPGLAPRWTRLREALLAERLAPEALPADEAAQEAAIRRALRQPGSVDALPPLERRGARPHQPVPLWLYGETKVSRGGTAAGDREPGEGQGGAREEAAARKRHAAERVESPENKAPFLMMFRAESLLSWGEFLKLDRAADEDPNPDAGRAAENLDKLAIAPDDGRSVASKLRLELDLPPDAVVDVPLGPGIPLPEWDCRARLLRPDWCRVQPLRAEGAAPQPLPERLRRPARKLKQQFAALAPARRWLRQQAEGTEPDLDACLRLAADRRAGRPVSDAGLYRALQPAERDLACLVLADLSLSTDAWASDEQRVIDVIRDSLLLFGEALGACGDRFGLYGFSSKRRSEVRFHELKAFESPLDGDARGRIAAIKPGHYTRMGAAIRQATRLLARQPARQRVLLMLSDGKPHDIDHYEGRYGVEDTRMSLIEARAAGHKPFCVTIDREGAAYLPHLFGPGGYTVLRRPEELPARLPLLYAQLTGR